MTIKEYFTGPVYYDENGQMVFIKNGKKGDRLLVDVRGWGEIQYMFKDQRDAIKFQDELGEFIAKAIQEKVERDL